MDYQTFHKYEKLVRRGLVKPLSCPHCGDNLNIQLGPQDEPALKCYYCGSLIIPGLAMYQQVKAVVQEHMCKPSKNKFYGPV